MIVSSTYLFNHSSQHLVPGSKVKTAPASKRCEDTLTKMETLFTPMASCHLPNCLSRWTWRRTEHINNLYMPLWEAPTATQRTCRNDFHMDGRDNVLGIRNCPYQYLSIILWVERPLQRQRGPPFSFLLMNDMKPPEMESLLIRLWGSGEYTLVVSCSMQQYCTAKLKCWILWTPVV